jgi:predicted AAA+ superfamily ATPase
MESQNPWWYGEVDDKYEEWKKSPVKWEPPILRRFNFKPYSLNFLVGPRQVGKTTTLKIYIHKLLSENVNPKSIFYFSCEELTDFRELGEVIDNYASFREANKISSSIIILDEITFVEDWHRAIKARIDSGVFKSDILIISGSASLEILRQKEYFPGRRGSGIDINFYPLSFPEYLKALKGLETVKGDILEIEKVMEANKIHKPVLKEFFNKYMSTGGFPLPIIEFFSKGRISFETRKIYIDWLKNDFRKLGRNESYMKEVLAYIVNSQCNPISWLSISRETSIASPHTAQAYVEDLKNLFVTEIINFLSQDSKILFRKNKKVYIIDPFLYTTICEYVKVEAHKPSLLESIVASHLTRKYETFYWRNKSEVDLIIKLNGKQIGIEVKTRPRSWRKPKHLDKILILTMEEIPLFLSSIDF